MICGSDGSLLGAAKAFIRHSSKVALVIAPLAAVQLVTPARAQLIFPLPGGVNDLDNGTSAGVSPSVSGFFQATVPIMGNGFNGTLLGANGNYTVNHISGGSTVSRRLSFSNSGGGTLPAISIPVAYSFVFGSTGTFTSFNWSLDVTTDASAGSQTIASGGSLGPVSGVGAYNAGVGGAFTSYAIDLNFSFTAAPGTTYSIAMDQGQAQGIAFNASAIPEPGTYAAWLGAIASGLAFWRQRRHRLASPS